MNSKTLKFAASALGIGATMVACSPTAQAFRPGSASASAAETKAENSAASAYDKAMSAAKAGQHDVALGLAERAVELRPQDIGYRMLLAEVYLKNGRFGSAETTFEDVLALDPGNVRAGLSVALARIALGRTGGAIGQLDEMQSAPPADLGLAYALAGEHRRAVEILEPAARAADSAPRVRQNLALAYALSGDWQKARTTAAQDVAPDQLAGRMEQWARIAQPGDSWDQVAALLGVTPSEDAGQPARLALAPRAGGNTALAAAEPVAAPAPIEQALAIGGPAPEAYAQAPAEAVAAPEAPAWVSESKAVAAAEPELSPVAEEETRPVYAAAVESLITPQAGITKASTPALSPVPTFRRPVTKAAAKPRLAAATGRFVVQLGAFGSAASVERAWASAYKRYGFSAQTPLSTTVKLRGGTFHRLSVAGFGSHADAARVCRTVKAKGGACFVRGIAGDAPTQWASRYTGRNA